MSGVTRASAIALPRICADESPLTHCRRHTRRWNARRHPPAVHSADANAPLARMKRSATCPTQWRGGAPRMNNDLPTGRRPATLRKGMNRPRARAARPRVCRPSEGVGSRRAPVAGSWSQWPAEGRAAGHTFGVALPHPQADFRNYEPTLRSSVPVTSTAIIITSESAVTRAIR